MITARPLDLETTENRTDYTNHSKKKEIYIGKKEEQWINDGVWIIE